MCMHASAWTNGELYIADAFRHSDVTIKAVHQHERMCVNLYCVIMTLTYFRLQSGHMTHEEGLSRVVKHQCINRVFEVS